MRAVSPQITPPDAVTVYKIAAARPLPQIDLARTVARVCVGDRFDAVVTQVLRRHFLYIAWAFRIGTLVAWTATVLPASVGCALGPVVVVLMMPSLVLVSCLMSVDMLRILIHQHEFVFLLLCNACNWALLACVFKDARWLHTVMGFVAFQVGLMNDAAFRTAKATFMSVIFASVVLVSTSIVIILRQIRTDPVNYRTFHVGLVTVELVDLLVNTNTTLVVFMIRLLYKRRRLIKPLRGGMVPCAIYRPRLALLIIQQTQVDVTTDAPTSSSVQQLRLVRHRLQIVQATRSLMPRWTPRCPIAPCYAWIHRFVGMTGIVCSIVPLLLPSAVAISNNSSTWTVVQRRVMLVVPTFGLACTVLFTAPLVLTAQRQLLVVAMSTFRNSVFLMVHVGTAVASLVDMMQCDYRSFGPITWAIWYLWLLLLDALPPCTRRAWRLRRSHMWMAVATVFFAMVYVLLSLVFFASIDLQGRVLFTWDLPKGVTLKLRTDSWFMNRMFPIVVWSVRLLWDLATCDQAELVLLKGNGECHYPFEMFPVSKK